jgi:hypothetical protein
MRREKGFTKLLKIFLISCNHTIEPGKKLLSTVIGVKDNGDSVVLCDRTYVVSKSNRSSSCS